MFIVMRNKYTGKLFRKKMGFFFITFALDATPGVALYTRDAVSLGFFVLDTQVSNEVPEPFIPSFLKFDFYYIN